MFTNRRGMSLVEVMVALGIGSIATMGTMSMISFQQKNIVNLRTVSARDNLGNHLARTIASERALLTSAGAAENAGSEFSRCLQEGANCLANRDYGFTLVSPMGERLAGPPTSPIGFHADGSVCDSKSSQDCAFMAHASFRADCGGLSSCSDPRGLSVKFDLSPNSLARSLKGQTALKAVTKTVDFDLPLAGLGSSSSSSNLGAAGNDGQIQYNSSGGFGASPNLVWNNSSQRLEVGGRIRITGGSPRAGRVLTSDGSGLATWGDATQPAGASGQIQFNSSDNFGASPGLVWNNSGQRLEVQGIEVGGQVRITSGSPRAGRVLTSDSRGLATWQDLPEPSSTGTGSSAPTPSPEVMVVSVRGNFQSFATCPRGWVRTGCSGKVDMRGKPNRDSKYHGTEPSGENGCRSLTRRARFVVTTHAYCLRF